MDKIRKQIKLLDISGCRSERPYTVLEYFGRFMWALATPFFIYSPRRFFSWRRQILRIFGARIGAGANVYPSTRIYLPWNLTLGEESSIGEWALIYNLGHVRIEDRATISHGAHLCAGTHDYTDPSTPLLRLPIHVGKQAWICSDAFIGPNTIIGEGAIVGARSVVLKDVPAWHIVGGHPAKFIKMRSLKGSRSEMI